MSQKITPDLQEWFALIHEETNVDEVTIYSVTEEGTRIAISHVRGSDEITVQRVAR